MSKRMKKEFVSSTLNSHFKLDKATKVMMALGSFPTVVKLSAKEQADQKVTLESIDANGFKKLMIRSQLSGVDAKLTGMNDPFWKPKKEEVDSVDGAGTPTTRKGKKQPKMRPVASTEANAS